MATCDGRMAAVVYTFMVVFILSLESPTASANDEITITPKAAQIKAVDSKIIFTCTVHTQSEMDEQESETWPDIVWIGPDKQVISESRGRVFVERITMNRHRLYITEVKESDSGQYTCRAHVTGTRDETRDQLLTAHSRLDLYEEIKFVDVNSNITRKAGTDALVNCKASGKPEPEVSWRFKGKRLVFVGSMKYSQEKGGLRIHMLQPEDQGAYECRAEVASQGNLKVQTINLEVVYPPVLTQSPESSATAVKGSDVTFHCQGHGNPSVEYRWFKEVITADDVVERYSMSADDETNTTMTSSSVSVDGSLLMRSVDVTDDGKYVCSISNNLGATETTVQFQVLVPPQITPINWQGQQSNITLTEGGSLQLPCSAKGRPEPEVYWTADEQDTVVSTKDLVGTFNMTSSDASNSSHVLTLISVTRRDSKVYTCNAVNSVGSATLDVALLVNYAPTIVVKDTDRSPRVWSQQDGWSQYAWYGQNRTFSCHANGRPIPDVVWLRGDDELSSDEIYSISETREDDITVVSKLQIRIPVKGDSSVYKPYSCIAKNSIGFDNFTAQLAEAVVPDMPRNVTVLETTSRSIRITVMSGPSSLVVDDIVTSHVALGGLDITSWVVTYEAAYGKSMGFVTSLKLERADDIRVTNLQPNTTYVIKVSAVNIVGVGTAAKIQVTTATASNDDKDFMSEEVQSDDGRYVAQYGAVNSGHRLKSRNRGSLDDEELFAVVDWGNTSAVLVVVGAVLLTTVVAAVLALVLHTRRRLVNDVRTTVGNHGPTVLNNKRERISGKPGDLNEVTSVKVSEGRDVDNLTLQIRGRRPPSPGTSIPDELYRSLGRSTKKSGSQTPQYGSAVPSPRLGARPGLGLTSSSGVTSPLPNRAVTTGHQTAQLAATVDVSSAQKNAWNDMIRGADQLEAVNIDMSLVSQQLEEAANDDDTKNVISNEGVSDSDEDDDSDIGFDHDDDDGLYDQQQQQPVFEGKSFLSYSP